NGLTTLPANHLAALDVNTGQPVDCPSADGTVFALAAAPDESAIYIGGSFKRIDGVKRTNFAVIAPDGSLLWAANCNSKVRAIATLGNTVYIGGSFTTVLGLSRSR